MRFNQPLNQYSLQDLQDFTFRWTENIHRAAYKHWTYESETNSQLKHKGFSLKFRMGVAKIVFRELLNSPNCEASLTIFEELGKELEKIIMLSDKSADHPFKVIRGSNGSERFSGEVERFGEFVQQRHKNGLKCYEELDSVFKTSHRMSEVSVDSNALNMENNKNDAINAPKKRVKV